MVDERPGDEGREHRHLALGEVEDAGRAVDQDERERPASPRRRPRRGRPRSAAQARVQSKASSISSPVSRRSRRRRQDARALPARPSEMTGRDSPWLNNRGRSVGPIRRGAARRSSPRPRPCRPRARTRVTRPRARARRSARRRARPGPRARSARRRSGRSRATTIGASPSDGSSSRTSCGRSISARASASICCSPPLSVPARWSRRSSSQREVAEHALLVLLDAARSRRTYAPRRRFSRTVRSVSVPRPSGTWAIPAASTASGELRGDALAGEDDPPLRRTVPEIARRVVVLPAPFAPEDRHGLALADGQRDPVQRLHGP